MSYPYIKKNKTFVFSSLKRGERGVSAFQTHRSQQLGRLVTLDLSISPSSQRFTVEVAIDDVSADGGGKP